jgi:hypothetical protein
MSYDFMFEADPRYATAALKCTLRRRLGCIGPAALVAMLVLVTVFAMVPDMRWAAYFFGGATVLLLVLFLMAVQARRRLTRRFYREAPHRNVRVLIDDDGLGVTTALGATKLAWRNYERVWKCDDVTLVFYSGWQYFAIPTHVLPPGALEFIDSHIAQARG